MNKYIFLGLIIILLIFVYYVFIGVQYPNSLPFNNFFNSSIYLQGLGGLLFVSLIVSFPIYSSSKLFKK